MGQEMVVPDWAKGGPAQAFKTLSPSDENLADGIGQSYPVIGYKGKVWSLRSRGERHTIVRPDDGTPSGHIDVIILGQSKGKSKSYYKAYDPNDAGERPICASMDGITPDLDVTTKQSDTCALCPRNVWKIDPATGRKGRECTDYKRLAVLIIPTMTQKLPGGPIMEPCFLRVPPASLNSLAIMGETMGNQGYHFSTYITRISFDPQEAHPKMVFQAIQALSDNEAPVVFDLRSNPNVDRITKGETRLPQLSTPAPTGRSPTTTAEQSMLTAGSTQPLSSVAKASAQPATPPTLDLQATVVQSPAPVSTGLGTPPTGLGVAPPAAPVSPQTLSTGDAGAPEASDRDLDDRIAGLIKASK